MSYFVTDHVFIDEPFGRDACDVHTLDSDGSRRRCGMKKQDHVKKELLRDGTDVNDDAEGVLSALPAEAKARKAIPLCTGVVDYFPDALAAVAEVSRVGNDQHNPGQPLHWAKGKSTDHADSLLRHLVDRGTLDVDGMRHSAKVAWRALALLQTEIENEKGTS